MIIKSRLWASLAVAFAMVLAAGLGVAGPATADTGSSELAAAETSEYGATLNIQYESQTDGYVRTTEYENATVTEMQIAECPISVVANKPTKSGSQIRGRGSVTLGRGCTGTWEVLVHIQIYSIEWIARDTDIWDLHAPTSSSFLINADCRRGQWRTQIIVQKGSEDQADASNHLNVTSC